MSSKTPPRRFDTSTYGFPPEAFDTSLLPNVDDDFIKPEDLEAFGHALQAPDPLHSPVDELRSARRSSLPWLTKRDSQVGGGLEDDVSAATAAVGASGTDSVKPSRAPTFITAQNDWAPINPASYRSGKGSKKRQRKGASRAVEGLLGTRTKDETREGYFYQLFKWPLLFFVFAWLGGLGLAYLLTRWYIWVYEHFFTWRGKRQQLRTNMRQTSNYKDWVAAARELDRYLGRQTWKEENDFAYYDSRTVRRVWDQMRKMRQRAETMEREKKGDGSTKAVDELRALIEACVKNNFVGVENARLYSQTYYGTKNLVQNFVDEGEFESDEGTMGVWGWEHLLTQGSREEPDVPAQDEAARARAEAGAVQARQRQLRADGALPVRRCFFRVLPYRGHPCASGCQAAAGRHHGH